MSFFSPLFRPRIWYNTFGQTRLEYPLTATAHLDPIPVWNGTRRVIIRLYDLRDVAFFDTEITVPHERNWNPLGNSGQPKWVRRSVPNYEKLNYAIGDILSKVYDIYRAYPGIGVEQIISLFHTTTADGVKEMRAQENAALEVPSRIEVLALAQQQTLTNSIEKLQRKLKKLKRR